MGEKPLHELIFNVGAVAPNAPTLTKTLNQAGHSMVKVKPHYYILRDIVSNFNQWVPSTHFSSFTPQNS